MSTALERAYQSRGYQTVQVEIPEQTGAGGVIRLQIVEARIERLRVNAHY